MKSAEGHEVDFLATARDGSQQLVQVAALVLDRDTLARELRSLLGAAAGLPDVRKLLLVGAGIPRGVSIPDDVELLPIWRWLLAPPPG